MKRGLKLSDSIYSGSKFDGLTVRNGRLINNRPDGQTGIAQAANIKKSMKTAEKISIVARGTAMGEMMSEMGDCIDCD
jgi:hypothetical protein